MKYILAICLSLFLFQDANTQKISLSEIIDSTYKEWQIEFDTLFFFQDICDNYTVIDEHRDSKFKIATLKKTEDLIPHLYDNEKRAVLSVTLLEFTPTNCRLNIKISKAYKSVEARNGFFYTFYDERIVQCKFDENRRRWIYDKTLEVYAHPPMKSQ